MIDLVRPARFVLAAVLPTIAAAAIALPAAAQSAVEQQMQNEQEACVERLESEVADPAATCTCMVEGLAAALDDEAYVALVQLVHNDAASEGGTAALETARQIVAGCLEG